MPYPDKLLADDEEVVRRLNPHWGTAFWPVVLLFLVVGGASFGAALVPAGPQQGVVRLAVVALALLLLLVFVAVPLARRRTTHHVVTTHRLLFREGLLVRHGRDLPLSKISDLSFRQTLGERLVRSGTLIIETAGDGSATVLRQVADCEEVQQLIAYLVEEDAERRAGAHAGRGWEDDGRPSDRGWHSTAVF